MELEWLAEQRAQRNDPQFEILLERRSVGVDVNWTHGQ